jgi:hypothetical protein
VTFDILDCSWQANSQVSKIDLKHYCHGTLYLKTNDYQPSTEAIFDSYTAS